MASEELTEVAPEAVAVEDIEESETEANSKSTKDAADETAKIGKEHGQSVDVEAVQDETNSVEKSPDGESVNDNVSEVKKRVSFSSDHLAEPDEKFQPKNDLKSNQSILKEPRPPARPARPARPMSPREKAKKTLKEAFPNIEEKYIIFALIASQGIVEPAFNALLFLSDPESKIEIPNAGASLASDKPLPPAKSRHQKQLEEDERLARKLAREFQKDDPVLRQGPLKNTQRQPPVRQQRRSQNQFNYDDDSLNSFFDEDLPQFKKQFEKGLEETKTKVGSFFQGLSKQIQDLTNDDYTELNDRPPRPPRKDTRHYRDAQINDPNSDNNGQLFGALGSLGSPPTSNRSSATFKRDEEFSTINLADNTKDLPDVPIVQMESTKTDIYGTPKKVQNSGAFENNNVSSTPAAGAAKSSEKKWEPLQDVPPQPMTSETFLVTSSDDEDEDEEEETQQEAGETKALGTETK